jgi:hypothetical protein
MTDATVADFQSKTPLALDGYIIGSGGLRLRPVAVPRDRYVYGSLGTVGGVMVRGDPYNGFAYSLHFGVSATVPLGFNLFLEEVSVQWSPVDFFNAKVGHQRVPFSLSQVALVTTLMFPNRAPPTDLFTSGADDGILLSAQPKSDVIEGHVGVFNGSSLGLIVSNATRVAPLFAGQILVQPLGPVPSAEMDSRHGPFRFGIGVSGLATSGKLYDPTGYQAVGFKDYRFNIAADISLLGFFLQGEFMHRSATDDYAGRPAVATAYYGEGTYFFPITQKLAVAPIGRIGSSSVDESFATRKTTTLETGLSIYPRADLAQPSTLRVIVEYTSERRVTENETAYGFLSSFQLVF